MAHFQFLNQKRTRMFNHRCAINLGFVSIVIALSWATPTASVVAQCSGHGGGGGHDHGAATGGNSHIEHDGYRNHLPNAGLPTLVPITPHGGQFLKSAANYFEVVYLPQETRVYLYDKSIHPLSARGLQAQMSMQIPGEAGIHQFSLSYVALPLGSTDQDYVATAIDVTKLPNEEIPITFRFENLPERKHPKAEFTPIFANSQIRPYVARVLLIEADKAGLANQQTCPITGAMLGSMGVPIKVLVGDRPLYLC